jgi:tetratricopeptide (TPR) repeat protein
MGEVGLAKGVDASIGVLEERLQNDALAAAVVTLLDSIGIDGDLYGDENPPSRAYLTRLAEVQPDALTGMAAPRAALLLGNLHAIRARHLASLRIDPEVQARLLDKEKWAALSFYQKASAEASLRNAAKGNEAMLHHLFGNGDEAVEELRPMLPAKPVSYKLARVLMENGRCDEAVEILEKVPLESRDARWTRLHREGEGL